MRRILALTTFLFAFVLLTEAQEKKTAASYFEKGEIALGKREYITAQAHFNECLRLDPYFAEAYRLRGLTREHLGETAKALTDFNVYMDLKPDNAEALFSRAVLRFESEQILPARQDFLRLLTLPPGETNTVYFGQEKYKDSSGKIFTAQGKGKDYIFNYLGMIETKLKRYDHAISWMDSAIRVAPDNAGYWINRGIAKLDKNDKAGATADFEQALKLEPDNSLALHNLATIKGTAGEATLSEQLLGEAIQKNGNLPYPLAERAYQRLKKNDLKGALEDYDEVVRLEPKDAENYINRGLVKEKMKDMKGAQEDFAKAIELDGENAKAWLCHGNIMSKQKRIKDAVDDYTVALRLHPNYGLAHYNRALAYQSEAKLKEACADLKKAEMLGVKIEPKLKEKVCK